MYIKTINKEAYKKLILYASKCCTSFSLHRNTMIESMTTDEEYNLNKILSNPRFSKDYIINNYSEKLIDEICLEYINDEKMFIINKGLMNVLSHLKNRVANNEIKVKRYNKLNYLYKKTYLSDIIKLFVFRYKIKNFLSMYKGCLIEEKHIDSGICYQFRFQSSIVKFLTDSVDGVYDFIYPINLEDLCIYINDDIWFWSIAHEKISFINCRTEEEYEKLKSFGIEFEEDKFEKEKELI